MQDERTKRDAGSGIAYAALFVLLAAVYLATGAGRFRIVDEVSLFALTESAVKRGVLDTNAIAWTQWVNSPGEVLGAFGPEGDVFAKKGPAPALAAAPFYAAGWLAGLSMLQAALWTNAVLTALTALLLARAAVELGCRRGTALAAAALYGLATIAWPYATHFFGEPFSALAILGLFYSLLRLRRTGRRRWALLAGAAAGVMIATSAAHAVLLAPFAAYGLPALRAAGEGPPAQGAVRRAAGLLAAFALPLAAAAGLLAWYNWARFGQVLQTGYHFTAGEGFTADWLQGLWGLLFSPYRGWFWFTPLALASVLAWPGFIRRRRAEGWLLLAVSAILIGLFAGWWMWWGGFAWGPRFLAPLAPLWVLVLAPWLGDPHSRAARLAFGLLAGLSAAAQALAVSVNYVNYEAALRQIYPTDWADPLRYGPPALYNPLHSPVLGQVRLLLQDAAAHADLGWIEPGRISWQAPLAALAAILPAAAAWWAARRGRLALGRGLAVLAAAGLALTAGVTAAVYARQAEYTGSPGYAAALQEIATRGGPTDGIVTIAPYHYQVPMSFYRGRLPIYGYAAETRPLHAETATVLERALTRHERLWLVTMGLQPADPANGVEAWLAEHACAAEDRWLEDARLAVFVPAGRLEPLPVTAALEGGMRLVSARLGAERARPGGALAVELVWQADQAWTGGPLRGFVQLLDPAGRLAAGQDGPPGGGYAAAAAWPAGQPVADRRGLLLPDDLPPGEYVLIAGLYDAATGRRLAVTGPAAAADHIRLAVVRVDPK